MSEKFSLLKLGSSLLTSNHWVKVLSLGGSFLFLVFVVLGVYRGYFKKPEPTTAQQAEEISNYYHQPRVTFGCAHWKGSKKFPTNSLTKSE